MKDEHDLELLIASRFPIISIETHEEQRAVQLLARCASRRQLPVFTWSVTTGWKPVQTQIALASTQDPAPALRHVANVRQPGVYALLDFHPFLGDPLHVRLLKEIATDHDRVARTVVLMSHRTEVPPELDKLAVRFALSLPDEAGIQQIFNDEVQAWQARNAPRRLKGEREAAVMLLKLLRGLAEPDVRRLVRHAIEHDGVLDNTDLPRLLTQKHQILSRDSSLSFELDTAAFADVAGLANLKRWLARRRAPFLDEAAARGLDVPKGIMLLGVQGCGKSLAAKAVAGTWGVPLMRLDFAALYSKWLGETERKLRDALKAADSMSPCVLWIDEIEKCLSSSDHSDNGESRRVLGTLLTWMAERRSRVFIVATSNDIESLPPELVRKGRLDEIFFVDLPGEEARREIILIHLRKRDQDPARFDLTTLARLTEGYSGAEIEQAVICALYEAHAHGSELSDTLVAQEIARTRPLSVVMGEKIAQLREWAGERTVKAD
ncbi:AAA family ATPase [Aquabacterium sp. A7-Y]|uniref:AAA family ATPase n=1 Tax=Aquabacterium sp. A7-Y TaxID=1349605 RepID=UPI00223DD96A|nr:AAA family ATPase [Aquabacterium sp. A7-Y]MCW7540068.1 AAA family ATPase [Aquabacterium sp. A7-Y]